MATLADAKSTVKTIVEKIKPISITLFGSTARQGWGEDLDLLIIVADKKDAVQKTQIELIKCLKEQYGQYAIDPFVVTWKTFNDHFYQGSTFLHLIAREGRTLYMKNLYQNWRKDAAEDVEMAELLYQASYFRGSCFHAQQAIEKYIKSRLLQKGWDLEKTHNIARLAALCREYKIKISIKGNEIIFIDSIHRGRYPGEAGLLPLKEPSKEEAARAIHIAKAIIKPNRK